MCRSSQGSHQSPSLGTTRASELSTRTADSSRCLEYITYTPHPTSEGIAGTLFKQHALIVSAFPTKLIARRIEKSGVDTYKSNAEKGKLGFEWVLKKGLELGGNGNGNGNGVPSLA